MDKNENKSRSFMVLISLWRKKIFKSRSVRFSGRGRFTPAVDNPILAHRYLQRQSQEREAIVPLASVIGQNATRMCDCAKILGEEKQFRGLTKNKCQKTITCVSSFAKAFFRGASKSGVFNCRCWRRRISLFSASRKAPPSRDRKRTPARTPGAAFYLARSELRKHEPILNNSACRVRRTAGGEYSGADIGVAGSVCFAYRICRICAVGVFGVGLDCTGRGVDPADRIDRL